MTLNGLIGRRGHLQDIQQFWIVGRFILISVLARDITRACLAAERMFLLNPPPWYMSSILQDLDVIKHKMNEGKKERQDDDSELGNVCLYNLITFLNFFISRHTATQPLIKISLDFDGCFINIKLFFYFVET